jgi:type I restriction enzyme S subunit
MKSTRKDWKDCLLGDVVTLKRGYDLPLSNRQDGPYPVITSSGFAGFHNEAKVKGPGVVTGRYGTLGEVHYIEKDFWPHNTALYVRDFKGNHPKFISYFLGGLHFNTQNAAAAVPGVNRNFLHMIPVSVPPFPVQLRIAGILSTYDDLMKNSQRRIRILEAMARALYREWFVYFRFPGHEKLSRVASPLGNIPQGWEVRTVKDIAAVTYGFPFQSKKFNTDGIGTPVIRIRDILDGSINTFTDEEAESKYHIKNGDILVGMDGDFHMCIWSSGHAFQNQRVAKFESNGEIGNYHLFLALELPIQTWNKSIVGTTVAHLGDMHIKTIQIAWPPAKILAKARDILEPMSEQIIALKCQVQNLRRTRDLLLPRLLSGQMELKTEAA